MIKPTVGRVVWYVGGSTDRIAQGGQVNAAIVAYVHSDEMVNLAVFDANGVAHSRTSVHLVEDGAREGAYCTWMPYQKGQAAKADALEQKLEQRA